jgi:hypothetical protein
LRKLWKTGVLAWKSSERYLLVKPMPQTRRDNTWPRATEISISLRNEQKYSKDQQEGFKT